LLALNLLLIAACVAAALLLLTGKALELREQRGERSTWPERLPNAESSVCPGARWVYSVSDDGSVSLTFREKQTGATLLPRAPGAVRAVG